MVNHKQILSIDIELEASNDCNKIPLNQGASLTTQNLAINQSLLTASLLRVKLVLGQLLLLTYPLNKV